MAGGSSAAGTGRRPTTDVVQKLLRKARKGTKVIYLPGNHDEFARQFQEQQFGGIDIVDEGDPHHRRRPGGCW